MALREENFAVLHSGSWNTKAGINVVDTNKPPNMVTVIDSICTNSACKTLKSRDITQLTRSHTCLCRQYAPLLDPGPLYLSRRQQPKPSLLLSRSRRAQQQKPPPPLLLLQRMQRFQISIQRRLSKKAKQLQRHRGGSSSRRAS